MDHTMNRAIRTLNRKFDVHVEDGTVFHLKSDQQRNDLGNGSWGKISFLVRHLGFSYRRVNEWPKGLKDDRSE